MSIETPGQVGFSPTKDHEVEESIIEQEEDVLAQTLPEPQKRKRVPGLGAGRITIHPSFFDPMTEEELEDWGC